MSTKKGIAAVLDPTTSVVPQDQPPKEQTNPRDELTHTIKENLENRIKQALRDTKASPEVQREALEIMHQRVDRINMLANNVVSDLDFKKDAEDVISTTVDYVKHIAHEGEENHGEHEKEHNVHRHEPEKPEKTAVEKMQEGIKKGVKSGRPDEPATVYTEKNNPLMAFKQNLEKKKDPINQSRTQKLLQKMKLNGKKSPKTSLPKPKQPQDAAVKTLIAGIEKNKKAMQSSKPATGPGAYVNPFSLPTQKEAHTAISAAVKKTVGQGNSPTLPIPKDQIPKFNLKSIPTQSPEQNFSEDELMTESGDEMMDRGHAVVVNRLLNLRIPETSQHGEMIEGDEQRTHYKVYPGESAAGQGGGGGGAGGGAGKKKKKKGGLVNDLEDRLKNRLLETAAKQAAMSILRHPLVIAGIIIVLLLIYLLIVLVMLITQYEIQKQEQDQANMKVTLSKTGPATGSIGQDLVYTINASYPGQAQSLQIVDILPDNIKYVSSVPKGVYDSTAQTVTWDSKALNIPLANPSTMNVKITIQALNNNMLIVNRASATAVGLVASGGGTISNGYIPPTVANCNGKYKLTNSIGKNFGDPNCTFTKDKLAALIKDQDPTHLYDWFNIIVPKESGYNPNAYAGPQTGTPDAAGAWGLYQMGSSTPPGGPASATGKNGKYDRGDVNWEMQTSNAITYNNLLISRDCIFWYWSTARAAGIARRC